MGYCPSYLVGIASLMPSVPRAAYLPIVQGSLTTYGVQSSITHWNGSVNKFAAMNSKRAVPITEAEPSPDSAFSLIQTRWSVTNCSKNLHMTRTHSVGFRWSNDSLSKNRLNNHTRFGGKSPFCDLEFFKVSLFRLWLPAEPPCCWVQESP